LSSLSLNNVHLPCDCRSDWMRQFLARQRIHLSRQLTRALLTTEQPDLMLTSSENYHRPSVNQSRLSYWQLMSQHLASLEQLRQQSLNAHCLSRQQQSYLGGSGHNSQPELAPRMAISRRLSNNSLLLWDEMHSSASAAVVSSATSSLSSFSSSAPSYHIFSVAHHQTAK